MDLAYLPRFCLLGAQVLLVEQEPAWLPQAWVRVTFTHELILQGMSPDGLP